MVQLIFGFALLGVALALAEVTGKKSGLTLGEMIETARDICRETGAELTDEYHGAGTSKFTK